MSKANPPPERALTAAAGRVIRERAAQLRAEHVGFYDALNRITDELIDARQGKGNRLTTIGAIANPNLNWLEFDSPTRGGVSGLALGVLLGTPGGPIGMAIGAGVGALSGAVFGRSKQVDIQRKERRAIQELVELPVSDVYR